MKQKVKSMTAITFIRLFGRVDRMMYEKLEKKLHAISPYSCLFLIFSSNGGDLYWARKASVLIHKVSVEKNLTTVGFGYGNVHSAALRIFLMCHYRLGLPTTKYLIHLPKDISFEMNDINLRLVNDEEIYFFFKMTGVPEYVAKQLFFQGVTINGSQALGLGITNLSNYQRSAKPYFTAM